MSLKSDQLELGFSILSHARSNVSSIAAMVHMSSASAQLKDAYRLSIIIAYGDRCLAFNYKWTNILKPSSNRSPYIFTLVQKVKHRVYKIHAF